MSENGKIRKKTKWIAKKYTDEYGVVHCICPYCYYEWVPRVSTPKLCPLCHRRLFIVVYGGGEE